MAHYALEVDFQNCLASNEGCAVSALLSWILDILNVFRQCGLEIKKQQKARQDCGPTMYQCIVGI